MKSASNASRPTALALPAAAGRLAAAWAPFSIVTSFMLWLGCPNLSYAQTPVWLSHWATSPGGTYQNGLELAIKGSGGIVCAGGQSGGAYGMDGQHVVLNGAMDMIIAALDPQGQAQWLHRGGGDCPSSVYQSTEGIALNGQESAVYSIGVFNGSVALFGDTVLTGGCGNTAEIDLFISRSDLTTGDFLWARGIRSYWTDLGPMLLAPDESAWVFARSAEGYPDVEVQFNDPPIYLQPGGFLVKYDALGHVTYADRISPHGSIIDAEWAGANILIGGSFTGQDSLWSTALQANGTISDAFVGVVDQSGTPQWITTLAADSMAAVTKVARLSDGTVIAAGIYSHQLIAGIDTLTTNAPTYVSGAFIASFSPLGSLNWIKPIEDSEHGCQGLFDLQVGPDDAIYLQGRFSGAMSIGSAEFEATAEHEMYVAKLNSAGFCTAMLRMGRMSLSAGGGSVVPRADAVYVSGTFDSTMVVGDMVVEPGAVGVSDFFVAKFDSLSGFSAISEMPLQEGALVIRANPNNGLCTIDLPQRLQLTEDLVLSVFDQSGQLAQRLPVRQTSTGVAVDIRAQAKGLYHVELADGRQRYTGTIVFE